MPHAWSAPKRNKFRAPLLLRLRRAASFCFYTLANPVRDELVKKERDWPYSGAIVPGYPDLHPLADGYWQLFWKLYVAARESEPPT